jgi:hypothetical protein
MPQQQLDLQVMNYDVSVIYQSGAGAPTQTAKLTFAQGWNAEIFFLPGASLAPVGSVTPETPLVAGHGQAFLPNERFDEFYRVLTSGATVMATAIWDDATNVVQFFALTQTTWPAP